MDEMQEKIKKRMDEIEQLVYQRNRVKAEIRRKRKKPRVLCGNHAQAYMKRIARACCYY
jgi:hypothetical protein